MVTINGNMVTVTVTGDMASGDRIEVEYHNVMVPWETDAKKLNAQFTVTDLLTGTEEEAEAAKTYNTMAIIRMIPPRDSTVMVDPPRVKSGQIRDMVTVTYTAKDTVPNNDVTIELPTDWEAAYSGLFEDEEPDTGESETSYVVVTKPDDIAEPDIGLGGIVTVTDDMEAGDIIVVTYHNVKVQTLSDRTPVKAQFIVTDRITGAADDEYEETTAQVTVNPLDESEVSVVTTPTEVKSGAMLQTVKVTYIAQDMVSDNAITVKLPDNLGAAYPENAPEFQEEMPAAGESASYVTVTSMFADNSVEDPEVDIAGTEVRVTVTGDMASGDRIVVTYHNVKVQMLSDRMSMPADITIMDKLSPDGTVYDGMAQITVNPPGLSTVTVKPPRVQASSIVENVEVTYVITDPIADNTITIELPDDWEAAYTNDGETIGIADFGTAAKAGDDRLQDIDLDGTTVPTVMAAVRYRNFTAC